MSLSHAASAAVTRLMAVSLTSSYPLCNSALSRSIKLGPRHGAASSASTKLMMRQSQSSLRLQPSNSPITAVRGTTWYAPTQAGSSFRMPSSTSSTLRWKAAR